jgi:methylase of polypeptide subunit release factors
MGGSRLDDGSRSAVMTPPGPEATAAERVRALLDRVGYSQVTIAELGIELGLGVRAPDLPVLRRALRGVEPLATLVRLFVLGDPVDGTAAERTLGSGLAALVAAGIAELTADSVLPLVRLTPWRGLLVAHDPDPTGPLWDDHVMGPNPAAETLADVIVGGRVASALDMGTGAGLLALLSARDADAVIATDVNPRALWLTSLNAALNGMPGVEARAGSLFEPVEGERFDRIVSNPPFVISPDHNLVFRHSPMPRDELSAAVVRGAATHLAPGGFGHVLVNWITGADEGWEAVPARWAEDSGCDCVVLLHGVEDPLAYAVRWNGRAQYVEPDAYPATLGRWLDYYERESISAIASGIVILRRSAGAPWFHSLRLDGSTTGAAGRHVEALFAAQDVLAATRDRGDLLRSSFDLVSPNRLDQALIGRDGEFVLEAVSLSLVEGLGLHVAVAPDLVPVALRLDGATSLEEIVTEVAAGTDADQSELRDRAVELLVELLRNGIAAPAPGWRP